MALWATESNAKGMFSTSSLCFGLPEHDEAFVVFTRARLSPSQATLPHPNAWCSPGSAAGTAGFV